MGGAGMGVFSGILAVVLGSPVLIAVAAPVWFALTYATGRAIYAAAARRRMRDLTKLADQLAAVTEDEILSTRALPGTSEPFTPRFPEPR